MPEYLRAEIELTLGSFALQTAFTLSAPWTILFGPSGAGKTSLLRVLSGLSRPQSGRVILRDRTLLDTTTDTFVLPGKRGIGFVTQRPALFPSMDVTANVAFGLAGLSRQARQERVTAMLSLFQAGHLAGRMPAHLSGGEKQRIALARALAPEPRLLLLDEPFTGMEAELKTAILQQLTPWLAERKIPALYVSHNVAEAFSTQGDVIVMAEGRMQAQGPARIVLAAQRDQLLRQLGANECG